MDQNDIFPKDESEQPIETQQDVSEQAQTPAAQDAAMESAGQTQQASTEEAAQSAQPTPQEAFENSAAQFMQDPIPAHSEEAPDAIVFPQAQGGQENAAQSASPAPDGKANVREKKPWNKKIWIAGCAALLVVVLVAAVIALAAGNSPLGRVEKALERTLSDMENSETAALFKGAVNGGSVETFVSGSFVNEMLLGASEQTQTSPAGMKLYSDLDRNMAALSVYAPVGEETFSAALHVSSDAVALEMPQVLDSVYGVNLKTFKDALETSVFAPDSGSNFALDEQVYEALQSQMDGEQAKQAKSVNDHAAREVKRLWSELLKSVKKHAEIVQTNETIAFMDKTVKTTRVRVRIDSEAMANIMRDTLTWVKEDKAFKKAVTEVCDFYAQALITGYGLNATDGQDLLDQFYDAVYEGIDACDTIEQAGGEKLKLDFYMTKSGGRLVQTELEVPGEFKCVLTFGPDPSAPALIRVRYDDGWDTYDVSYSVETNDKREYAAKFSVTQDSLNVASASIDWNKKEDDLRIKLNDPVSEESILIKGSLHADKKEAELHIRSITLEDEIIKPDLTVIIKTDDKMPEMPEYTDLLTLDEAAFAGIFENADLGLFGMGGNMLY